MSASNDQRVGAATVAMTGLTWGAIRRMSIACASCRFMFVSRGVPCLAHTLESERSARARIMGLVA